MSFLTIHTRCLSVRDPWETYLSMHLSRRTTRPSINSNLRGARYVPRNIISIAARDTTLENSTSSSYHNHVSDTMQMTCSNENVEITILITKRNLLQGIQHQQISNKSPSHSQYHTRKYTSFIRLSRVSKSTCLNHSNNHSGS